MLKCLSTTMGVDIVLSMVISDSQSYAVTDPSEAIEGTK